MINFSEVKLVIWDLDETLWHGTLSEGNVDLSKENKDLILKLTDIGIVNSICSKNDFDKAKEELTRLGVWNYFVFSSINWDPKGERVKRIIGDMHLRANNVLFIDDNISNLGEVEFYNKGIMTLNADHICELMSWVDQQQVSDMKHSRLEKYKILEKKNIDQKSVSSNIDFLYNSMISVSIYTDCMSQIDRIAELVSRTNQLNYTKIRSSKDELIKLISQENVSSGYVIASDKYGDYGVIGFYLIEDNKLKHFLFSCRTLGMGIEQYVYSQLNFPEYTLQGDVATKINKLECSPWINCNIKDTSNSETVEQKYQTKGVKVLMKGPCDMMQIFSFIREDKGCIDWEYTFVGDKGASIEQHNHTECIKEARNLNKRTIAEIAEELPFGDKLMFSDKIYEGNYDIVFLSMLTDGGLGLYQNTENGVVVAYGEYTKPLTDKNNWDGYINNYLPTGGATFTKEFLEDFTNKYVFLGRISVESVIENIKFIRSQLRNETLLVLLTGVEIPYLDNHLENYADRHIFNQELNAQLRKLVEQDKSIRMIEFGKYVTKQSDFFNNINHFVKPIYFHIARDMIEIIESVSGDKSSSELLKNTGHLYAIVALWKQKIYKFMKKDKFNKEKN